MVTEQTTTQVLEDVLKEGLPSGEKAEVSEEMVEEEKIPEGKAEESEKELSKETTKFQFSQEQETEIQRRIDSERDKHTNSYREKRESDTALIRSLNTTIRELKASQITKVGDRRIEAILSGDVEAGIDQEESLNREKALKEFNEQYKEFKGKSAEVEETAVVIAKMAEALPKNIVEEFGLNDANPNLRASNGVKFLEEAISVYKHNQDFLMTLENFLPKGDELRKQLDEIVQGLAEFDTDKSKKLYLKDRLQGVKVARKAPKIPSDGGGGSGFSNLKPEEKIARILERERS